MPFRDPTKPVPVIVRSAEQEQRWDTLVKAAIGFGKRSAQACILAGRELVKAKAICPGGLWLKTLEKQGLNRRTAARWIRAAKEAPDGMGHVSHLHQVFDIISDPNTHDELETSQREVGDEPSETVEMNALLALIVCKDCRRKGRMKDCKKCEALRGRARAGAKKKGKKGGGVLFDWREFDKHWSRTLRMPNDLARRYPEQKETPEYREATELLMKLAELVEEWRSKVQQAKP